MYAHDADDAQCTFLAQSSAVWITHLVTFLTEVLRIAYVTIGLTSKQPLCARQNGFSTKEHKLTPAPEKVTPGFQQLIYHSR